MKGRGWGSHGGKGVGITWREGGGDHVKGRGWGSREGKGVITGRGWGSREGKGVGIM